MIKKALVLFTCLLLMTACVTKDIVMEKMSYKGNTLVLNLESLYQPLNVYPALVGFFKEIVADVTV